MADQERSEVELLYHFLGQQLESGEPTLSVDEAVAAFQQYQRDLGALHEKQGSSGADDTGP